MLAGRLPWLAGPWRPLVLAGAVAALAMPLAAVSAPAGAQAASFKRVSYRGYSFEVPRSWPVIDLAGTRTCVRFDRHAVYLGAPSSNESCPSLLVGTTEALLIQPGPSGSFRSSIENSVARHVTVSAPWIKVTATFDDNAAQIDQILASAALPAPVIRAPDPAAAAGQVAGRPITEELRSGSAKANPPALPVAVANYRGRGFDACTAPSAAYMSAWRSQSPYRAIGVYIGGSDEACAQPNLTPKWLRREAAAGWHFLPMYVGPQASFGELSSPAKQGTASAEDAVMQAERLGFGPQTPLYYDMESFSPGQTGKALRFLSAWTSELHALGYSSGIYSSSSSGIAALAQQYSGTKYVMPDVIYDALWNGKQNTKDSVYMSGEWPEHQRVHQYAGNVVQTFGGDTINIDKDYLNVSLPLPGGTSQASSAVIQNNGVVDAFYRGSSNKLWYVRFAPKSGWAAPVALANSDQSAPTAVNRGPGDVDVFYQGPQGDLWQVARRPGGRWSPPHRLKMMGKIGGAPTAVAQSNGVIDIFWKGSADVHLWHGQFSPAEGWSGPQRLGGSVASSPSPVEATPGTVEVFWEGTDNSLWYVIRRLDRSWSRPTSLGMGPLGGPPQATAGQDGATEVFWAGSGNSQIWSASFASGKGWHGPRDLGGHLSGLPSPVTLATGPIRIFFRGQDGRLWQTAGNPKSGWHAPVRQSVGTLGAAPFVAIGYHKTSPVVFWKSTTGKLWSASLKGSTWTKPREVGDHVA